MTYGENALAVPSTLSYGGTITLYGVQESGQLPAYVAPPAAVDGPGSLAFLLLLAAMAVFAFRVQHRDV